MLKLQTVLQSYSPVFPPYNHQSKGNELAHRQKGFGFFMDMGTGKTKVVIDEFSQLFLDREIDGVIIAAPKMFYLNWLPEMEKHLQQWIPKRLFIWDADATPKKKREVMQGLTPKDDTLDILLINIEAFSTEVGYTFLERFARMHYNYITIDESTCIKSHMAERFKKAKQVGQWCDFRRILTGTPMSQGPLDLWGQIEFLEPGFLGFSSFTSFKHYYAEVRRITLGTRSYEKITAYKNLQELYDRIKGITYRVLKSECLDLPDKVFNDIQITQTPEQKRIYQELKEEFISDAGKGNVVSSTSILTIMMKLHQVNCGFVKDNNGNIIEIPNNRLSSLVSLIECIDGKIIIWCKFKHDIKMIIRELEKEFGEHSAVHYYGETTVTEAALHVERFRRDPTCRFFVSNEAGSKSLTLIESHTSIYYSYDHKPETYWQSQDRNHRIGQTNKVTYHRLWIPKTIDEKIIKSLERKHDVIEDFMSNWKAIFE